jgi:hypothetical protein
VKVELGAQRGGRIVITSGLEAGASILVQEGVLFQ